MLALVEGRKLVGEPREKPSEQGENQQQTEPTYHTGPESNTASQIPSYSFKITLQLSSNI